ncbi:UbiD family decarboxylase [Leucobacter allii]|uniref:UbiD family decarboxylase n=1 Tax=Leucobacter allii TaxID=2932247 RepID=A0ABY4FKQ4_9MICO|nr:UbiD family decarboxylase [Leucobacter allii]UOQ56844.1 UbiD family decarboxylase [Leucobacter allii]
MTRAGIAAAGLREELDRFAAAGLLLRVEHPVSARFEACAHAAEAGDARAVLFAEVGSAARAVAMNTTGSRALVATSLGVRPEDFAERYLEALSAPVPPEAWPAERGAPPVHEIVVEGEDIDLTTMLPVLTHHEHDGGPYITSGVVFGEHDGVRNLSYHRMQLRGPRETGIVVVQRHLHRMLEAADAADEPLPVAVAIGLDAGMLLAAATSGSAAPYGFDELGIVGGLRREPVRLVPGRTVPLQVPACAEIVIEGHILPNTRAEEGPFAEFDGSYEHGSERVFRASALTMRRGAIYQGLVSGSVPQLNIMGLPNEAVLLRAIRAAVPGVERVHVTLGGLRKFHAIVSVRTRIAGDAADAIVAAFAGHRDLKQVVVVDHDVDVFDAEAVERAVATAFQPDRGLVLLPRGRGNPVDRSLDPDGTTSRMGIDATRPVGSEPPVRARIPGRDRVRLPAGGGTAPPPELSPRG